MIRRQRIYTIITAVAAVTMLSSAALAAPFRIGSFTELVKDPLRVAVDGQGKVYVTESSGNAVKIFDRNGKLLKTANVPRPTGIAIGPTGLVYVGSEINKSVEIYTADLVHSKRLTTDEISRPSGIAVDAGGRIYVTDTLNDRVRVYDSAGALVVTIGSSGSANGQFTRPKGIAVSDAAGEVYVSDFPIIQLRGSGATNGARIQVFTKAGAYVRSFGQYGINVGQISTPEALALDKAGRLYVADSGQNAVHILDPATGSSLGALYDMTRPMVLPLGVAVAKNSIVYVTSYGTSSIEVYALDGYVTMAVSDAALSFEARQYGPNPEIKSITISNGGAGTLNWTATADKEWIALGQAAGTTAGGGAAQLGIGVNISSLPAGVHTGIVTIASDFGQTDTIGITLALLPPATVLPSNGTLLFSGKKGKAVPPQEVTISVENIASLPWSATSDAPWLSIAPASGSTTTKAAVSVNTTGLGVGPYAGTITLAAPGALGGGSKITASLTITSSAKLSVTTNRSDARFSITGPANYTGSGTAWSAENVPAGDYTVSYEALSGYRKPQAQTKSLAEDGQVSFDARYVSWQDLAAKKNIIVANGSGAKKNDAAIKVFKNTGEPVAFSLTPFESGRGVNVAAADVNGDGVAELIVGTGDGAALVRIFKADKSLLAEFTPSEARGGAQVAAGDLDGDGKAEVIVAAEATVKVYGYDAASRQVVPTGIEFIAHECNGGVSIAVADTEGDQKPEIITAPSSGTNDSTTVRVWKVDTANGSGRWNAAASREIALPGVTGGAVIAAANTDADAQEEIIVGVGKKANRAGDSFVGVIKANGSFSKFAVGGDDGVNVAAADLDGDGAAEIIAAEGETVKIYSASGTALYNLTPFKHPKHIAVAVGELGL